MKLDISIDGITLAQAAAIQDLLRTWQRLGEVGSSRLTAFYADGDGTFRPQITINGETLTIPSNWTETHQRFGLTSDHHFLFDEDHYDL